MVNFTSPGDFYNGNKIMGIRGIRRLAGAIAMATVAMLGSQAEAQVSSVTGGQQIIVPPPPVSTPVVVNPIDDHLISDETTRTTDLVNRQMARQTTLIVGNRLRSYLTSLGTKGASTASLAPGLGQFSGKAGGD